MRHACRRQQVQHQPIVGGGADRQHLWIVPIELFPQPVGSASEFDFQLVFKPGKLSLPKQIGAVDVYPLVALPVCALRAGQNKGISGIVLCAGDGETVTKPVYLFRIDREQSEATLEKSFD